MPDQYTAVRSLSLRVVFAALGIDLSQARKRSGKDEWYMKCPYHEAKTNNTAFSFTDELAHCFSCQVRFKGSLDAVMQYRKCNLTAAAAFLQPLLTQTPAQQKTPVLEDSGASGELRPFKGSYHKFAVPCPWLEARIADQAVRERYGVFQYHNPSRQSVYDGMVMIPIRDVEGVLYGYLARTISLSSPSCDSADTPNSNQPKYIWPKGLPKAPFLFGSDVLKAGMFGPLPLRVVYLVESPWSVMRFASFGLPAVSPYGWSVSDEQIALLSTIAKGVVFLPDANKRQPAGEILPRLSPRLWVRFPPLPAGIDDPEQLQSREQILAL